MFNKIIHTLGSRAIMAVFNMLMLLITTRWMGPEVKGQVSLLVLNLTIGALVAGFVGGPALVYLTPRKPIRYLLIINHLWSFISAIPFVCLTAWLGILDSFSVLYFFPLMILESMVGTHILTLLGSNRVREHNIMALTKVALVPLTLI